MIACSISTCATALFVPEEMQGVSITELLADLFPLYGELSSDSLELLPMWVRRECAVAFRREKPDCLLPSICKDASKSVPVGLAFGASAPLPRRSPSKRWKIAAETIPENKSSENTGTVGK